MKIRPAKNKKEEEIERKNDMKFQEIIAEGKADREIITTTKIRKAIKRMKNNKAGDKNNWKQK